MANFDDQFQKLNPAQRRAVEAIEGPVLVIAGPGTGKTQLLSMRVANIMRAGNTDAANILCLTFTNKAALNMRDRLLSLVGPEANKTTVKTFHGFAAEIMSNYPDYFWNGAKLSTAPEAIQLEIVQLLLTRLPLSNPLSIRFAGQYTATDDVLKALRLAKEAGLTPDKLRAVLELNMAYIDVIEPQITDILGPTLSYKRLSELQIAVGKITKQDMDSSIVPLLSLSTVIQESLAVAIAADQTTGKTKQTGKWKSRWLQTHDGQKGMFDERRRNHWWLAFCDAYQQYRTQLHERGYYDYSDMLLEVIVQLEQNADLRANIQERFQYVLIDEFQDSNAAQLRLAHLVADHHTAEGAPNLMAVGDDDQSIFGFNGAELNNMLFFDRNYPTVQTIVLEDNYRSSQAVLDTAGRLIEQAEDRLVKRVPGITKELVARNTPSAVGRISHVVYPTREHQLSEVARLIAMQRSDTDDSIAVLARGHESLRSLAMILLDMDVAVRYEQQSNVLDHEIIKQIILLAEVLVAINQGNREVTNQKIAIIVRHPMWRFKPADLWQLAIENFVDPDWLECLRSGSHPDQRQFADWLLWLAAETERQPLPVILEYLLGLKAGLHLTSPVRSYYLETDEISTDYLHGLSAIRLLRELVTEFSADSETTLADFVRFIAINRDNGRGITDESVFVSSPDAVELYTVHKAKGLEFDQVFIIDAVEDNWKPRVAGRKPPANLPLQPPGEQDDDYIRLLYVAITRAKHTLIVSSYRYDQTGNEVLATPFIRQAIPETIIPEESSVQTVRVLEENMRWPRLTVSDEKASLATQLANYRLSATHLLNFLDITNGGPQYFLERHLLRLPEAKTATQGYGSAMHSAMQLAQKLVNQNGFELAKIIDWYGQSLRLEHLPADDYQKYLIHGGETLHRLFNELDITLVPGGQAEQYMNDIRAGEALLTGFIDRIDTESDKALITDYKTGVPLASFATRDQTKAVKAWRHRSQLIFYALLLRNHPTFSRIKEIECQMVYLEAESQKELVRSYTPGHEEIGRMQALANATWKKINDLDFPDVSAYPADIEGISLFENDLLNGN